MKKEDLQHLREDYTAGYLHEKDLLADPIQQFDRWLEEAVRAEIPQPNAMTMASVDEDHKPHTRVLLLKGVESDGFTFFTNYASNKGRELENNPYVSLCFLWLPMARQVRIAGYVEKLSEEENIAYFKTRPYKSQIGALASNQSEILDNRSVLEEKFQKLEEQYATGEVPKPESWGGYKVIPEAIEFWQGRESRLHDRIKYIREQGNWIKKRLSP